MPQRLDSFSTQAYFDEALNTLRPAPGKVTSTQRMTAKPASAAGDAAPLQRELDPVAAAIQRKHLEHDLAASMGFLGGPAASIDASLVQLKADAHTGLSDDAITAHAAAGVAGGGRDLPHLDAIQRSFGPHDVSDVRAHVGGAAADASSAIGAHAYATGNDVAFAREPDLFLAAHEAAHVVQQRQGVHLSSAVGQDGDPYERHADDVAAAVVRGESAADLLGPASAGVQRAAVQRKWTETVQSSSDSKATITVSGLPSTKATFWATDGSGTHSENPYGGDSFFSDIKVWPHAKGYVSLDVFALASMGDSMIGDLGWNTAHQIDLNAIVDTSFVDGKFHGAKRPMNPAKLPDAGVELVGEHELVDDGTDPRLMVRMTITPTGQRKEGSSTSVKGGADLTVPIIKKGAKGEINETWSSEQSWRDGAIRKEYGVLMRLQGGRKAEGEGGGGGGGNVSINNNSGGNTTNNSGGNTYNNSGGNTYNSGGNTTNNSGGNTYNSGGNTTNNSGGNKIDNSVHNSGGNTTNNTTNNNGGNTYRGGDTTITLIGSIFAPDASGKPTKNPVVPPELRKLSLYYDVKKSDYTADSTADLMAYAKVFKDLNEACVYDEDLRAQAPVKLLEKKLWKFAVSGLASSTGSDASNKALSDDRAKKARERIAANLGISAKLLADDDQPPGVGEEQCKYEHGDGKEVESCRRVDVTLS